MFTAFFKKTAESNICILYTFPDLQKGGVLHERTNNVIEKYLRILDITDIYFQECSLGPNFIEEKRRELSEKVAEAGCMKLLAESAHFKNQNYE